MLRFVDISIDYWIDDVDAEESPMAAFLDTITDTFLTNDMGSHTFITQSDVDNHPQAARLTVLLPPNFFMEG
jgi:hypothetical protein